MIKWECVKLMRPWQNPLKSLLTISVSMHPCFHFQSSKGDIKSAAKFLEMFVSVAEGAGLQESLADACSATGTMYNTMVCEIPVVVRTGLIFFPVCRVITTKL